MGAFHQLGHHSQNLVADEMVGTFAGAILSPVNYDEAETGAQVAHHQSPEFECVLDPQLYVPTSNRGKLPGWSHFPSDVDTADLGALAWWHDLNQDLAGTLLTVGAKTVASPCVLPQSYAASYFDLLVDVGDHLRTVVPPEKDVLLTVAVKFDDLTGAARVMEIASVISRTRADGVYLVLHSGQPGRRELDDSATLGLAASLVSRLSGAGLRVIVGYCGTDLVLWKHAGAQDCATGKFWNLRRFGPERWQEAEEIGGGHLPYWLEPSLLAYLREGDLARLDALGSIPALSKSSPPAAAIVAQRAATPEVPWVGLSWRQHLRWFSDYEATPHSGFANVHAYLRAVEEKWESLEDGGFLMEERRNDGRWVRPWRIAARSVTP